ncbi:ferrous iron transport protein B [Methanococcoides sp. SA1]|nr:ferrous iron transport protein B [Methanococcoides sp. SA1]
MENKKITVALTGNPNVGKTTVFNSITGSRQKVGNWAGVTVEKKIGNKKHAGYDLEIVDLPGTYSLTAYSIDEIVARDYVIEEHPDVVVQVVDATNLERNMYLTTQLMELGTRVVIALNMSDLADARGDTINIERMNEFLEIPVVRTSANKREGLNELLDEVIKEALKGKHHEHEVGYGADVENDICRMENVLRNDSELTAEYPIRWLSVKLLEGDENVLTKVENSDTFAEVKSLLSTVDQEEYEATMADKRYESINAILPQVCKKCVKELSSSDLVDKVVTNKYLGIPIFLAMMWGAFEITFSFAAPFMGIIDMFFGWLAGSVAENISTPWLASLLGDGIIAGVGSVLIFVPNIFILFFLLSLLEDSGYMARAAFIMDRLMYAVGLQGKSFIPLLMGFGCNVPAIMGTRTIEDDKDRLITILVTPFMSCGARLPVYILLAGTFFGREAGTIIFGLYVLGIVIAILSAKLIRTTLLKGSPSPFIMELPPYRLPSLKMGLRHMWNKGYLYLRKAGTIILAGVVLVWLLATLPFGVEYGSEASLIGMIGHLLEPLVEPLGFDWKIAVALIFGVVAKEIVLGSLGVLYGTGEDEATLSAALLADPTFSPAVALGLMVFTLLYVPCMAVIGVVKKETGSWKWTLFLVLYGTVLAWVMALIVFKFSGLFGL